MNQPAGYEVIFYRRADGSCPTDEYLDTLEDKVRSKVQKWMLQLEIYGPHFPRPYADVIRGKIRELRVGFASQHYRFLYFFAGKRIVITHGFLKKTSRVPEEEIELAQRRMKDFCGQFERGEIEP